MNVNAFSTMKENQRKEVGTTTIHEFYLKPKEKLKTLLKIAKIKTQKLL